MRRRGAVKDLAGKRCLITGAASGIGKATALAAAARGAELFLTDIQPNALRRTVNEIEAVGGKVRHSEAIDLTNHDAVAAMAGAIHDAHGSVDVVMNVAGISTWGRIQDLEHHHWQRTIDINLIAPISVLECFVPAMIEAGRGGHIVNVSSAAGLFGLPWHAPYSASKFGLRGVSEVLRFDLHRHRIGVSLVCPGAVKTPLVGTVNIVGIDRDAPHVKAMVNRFERHAVSPETVAEKIIEGIERNRYMVYTSADIRIGHWAKRLFAPPYELVMRLANRRFDALAEQQH